MRIDKWLWAARFFKTRALASRAFELGRIHSNGQPAKPSREVRAGDLLQVKNDSGDFQIEVVLLSQMRGPAAAAQTLYRETEASREARQEFAEERKDRPDFDAMPSGKPSKRDRRKLDREWGRARETSRTGRLTWSREPWTPALIYPVKTPAALRSASSDGGVSALEMSQLDTNSPLA
ncbi:MAG TPA: RNA-binding S4 domain-containing protein [Bryobacteraceae bacterium]|nr:RNA-binding S4 domain-containing protein [Bryobacteraceae bacterium]